MSLRFLLQRVAVLVVTILVVAFVTFLVPYLTPGDPVRKILRSRLQDGALALDDATVEKLRVEYGLDQPLLVQFFQWVGNAFQGDFGVSYTSGSAVFPMVGAAIGVTATLALVALAIAVLISLPLGSVAAINKGKPVDTVITTITQAFVAIPEYWIAPLLILVFAVNLAVLPSAGWNSPASMVLPCITLALRPISYFTQVARASMVDVLGAPYIVGARARGLNAVQTIVKHGVRNTLIPVVTLVSVWLAGLLGGSVVIEVIFGIPGMGRLVYNSVLNGDIPLMQASIISIVTLTVIITTLTDLLYSVINPTVRSASGSSK
jgi:peptide/nickel transport system permease protein